MTLKRDSTIPPEAPVVSVAVIGELERAIILSDTYFSVPGGLSFCRSGLERFLRVIALGEAKAEQTLYLKLSSCRQNIELATVPEWEATESSLKIHWLTGPDGDDRPEDRTYRVRDNGSWELISEVHEKG